MCLTTQVLFSSTAEMWTELQTLNAKQCNCWMWWKNFMWWKTKWCPNHRFIAEQFSRLQAQSPDSSDSDSICWLEIVWEFLNSWSRDVVSLNCNSDLQFNDLQSSMLLKHIVAWMLYMNVEIQHIERVKYRKFIIFWTKQCHFKLYQHKSVKLSNSE